MRQRQRQGGRDRASSIPLFVCGCLPLFVRGCLVLLECPIECFTSLLLVTSCGRESVCAPKKLRNFQVVICKNICLTISSFQEIFISWFHGGYEAKLKKKMSQYYFCFKLGIRLKIRPRTPWTHACVPYCTQLRFCHRVAFKTHTGWKSNLGLCMRMYLYIVTYIIV